MKLESEGEAFGKTFLSYAEYTRFIKGVTFIQI